MVANNRRNFIRKTINDNNYSIFDIYSQKNFLNNSFRTYRTSIKIDKCKNKKWSYFKMSFEYKLNQFQMFFLNNSMYFLQEIV